MEASIGELGKVRAALHIRGKVEVAGFTAGNEEFQHVGVERFGALDFRIDGLAS